MKKVLIVGAGIYQVPLIRAAKEMGLYTIVTSIPGNYPGFDLANKVYHINTKDQEKLLKIAENEKISGICTTGTDVAVKSIGYVCEKYNLPGINLHSAILATDKLEMKKAFSQGGVRTAKYWEVKSLQELNEVYEREKKELILKTTNSSGSRGIVKITPTTNLEDAYAYVKTNNNTHYIVEEFIDGIEFGAQVFLINGKIKLCVPHGDVLFSGKTNVPIGHYLPYHIPSSAYGDMEKQIEKVTDALGLKNGALNFDFILSNNEVYVIEVGARAGATCLPELISIYCGINYYNCILEAALGFEAIIPKDLPQTPCANILFIGSQKGKLKSIEITNTEFHIFEKLDDYNYGDMIPEFQVGPDRLGHVIFGVKNENDPTTDIEKMRNSIQIRYL